MKALDTNVQAHRQEMPGHSRALDLVRGLAGGMEPWALAWPCVYEFVRVVTHPRVFDAPTPLEDAIQNVEALLASPSVVLPGEGARHVEWLRKTCPCAHVSGNLVFDADVAALLLEHGVDEIVTSDADFHRFKGLRVTNPFAAP